MLEHNLPPLSSHSDPAATGLRPSGNGMWIDPEYAAILERAGLGSFDQVMATQDGHCWRTFWDRENWRLDLAHGDGRGRGAHLKKHHVRTWQSFVRAHVGLAPRPSAGRVEAEQVARLTADGIAVMRLIAYGERFSRNGMAESFLLAEELAGFTELEYFLMRNFPPLAERRAAGRDRRLDRLIREVAELARRFHGAGYNHRDFYCGHFFVRESSPGRFDIRLIDLQRVQYRRRGRRRWLVKDLGQLLWSLPAGWISCSEKIAFMQHYFGVRKLQPHHKRFVRAVLARSRAADRRLGPVSYPKLARFEAPS
jgi:heptose I phosphotransferase